MSKLKTPFLSLGASGTIGNAITVQERHQESFVREKPIPAYRRTLPQVYQRWLYEDYAYLWTKQTVATKQTYASAGVRHHLTGFQYWMKHCLTNLPWIAGMWYLDEKAGAIAYDSSRNANHGVILGASPAGGLIDGAQYFDGINDLITFPSIPPLNIRTNLTIILLTKPTGILGWPHGWAWATLLTKATYGNDASDTTQKLNFYIRDGGALKIVYSNALSPALWYPVACIYDGSELRISTDGLTYNTFPWVGQIDDSSASDLLIGATIDLKREYQGIIDHLIVYNRVLDATEIARWAGRRYPAQ